MSLDDFGQIKTRLLTCGSLLLGGALCGSVIAGLPGVAAFSAIGGAGLSQLATNLLTELAGGDLGTLAERLGRNDNLLNNGDLTQAVSRSIAGVIQSIAKTDMFLGHKKSLEKLATTAANHWQDIAEATKEANDERFETVWEDQLPAFFATDEAIQRLVEADLATASNPSAEAHPQPAPRKNWLQTAIDWFRR